MEKFINLLRKIRRFDYSTVKISDRENFLPGEKNPPHFTGHGISARQHFHYGLIFEILMQLMTAVTDSVCKLSQYWS